MSATFAETFMSGDQQPSHTPQRVLFAATVAQGVVLDPAAHLVDAVVAHADHMERISDLTSVWQRHIEGSPIRP